MVRSHLLDLVRKSGASPFIFAGAGLGRRYLNLPTWDALLRKFAAETARPYEYYVTIAGRTNYPKLGAVIAEAFRDVWWASARGQAISPELASQMTDFSSPLKVEISKFLQVECAKLVSSPLQDELRLLRAAKVDGIITTNYDTILEQLFPDYKVYSSQDDTLFQVSHGIGEIFKIHGCATRPNTLVLTEEDYAAYNEKNAYLAAKLTTLFLEHPFIFLGYSISDPNVRSILQAVTHCLPTSKLDQLRNRLIFVEYMPGSGAGVADQHTMGLGQAILPVTRVQAESFTEIFSALGDGERTIPVSVLRRVKERVYELVRTADPKGALRVVDLNNDSILKDLEVVVGVGISNRLGYKGYDAISRVDLVDDVLNGGGQLDPLLIVKSVLPRIVTKSTWVPVWRYVKAGAKAGLKMADSITKYANKTLADFRPKGGNGNRPRKSIPYLTILEISQSRETLAKALYLIPQLRDDALVPDELRVYLMKHRVALDDANLVGVHSQYIKLVSLLDYLENGRSPGPTS
jgi:hypothetical protein